MPCCPGRSAADPGGEDWPKGVPGSSPVVAVQRSGACSSRIAAARRRDGLGEGRPRGGQRLQIVLPRAESSPEDVPRGQAGQFEVGHAGLHGRAEGTGSAGTSGSLREDGGPGRGALAEGHEGAGAFPCRPGGVVGDPQVLSRDARHPGPDDGFLVDAE